MGIRNFSPHLRNSAILRTNKTSAELRTKKSCGTVIADLQNMTSAIPQLSAVSGKFSFFLGPFPQLRMFLKINQNIFRIVCFCGNQKRALKGWLHEIFGLRFFFMNRPHMKISSCCSFKNSQKQKTPGGKKHI